MALTSGFFNSLNGDRVYNADQMSEMFEGLITNGIYESVGNQLAVEANSGMSVQVDTGRGYFSGKWVKNDSILVLPLPASDSVLSRYDAVVIKVDKSESERDVTVYIKSGELATSPERPTMTHNDSVNEYCLAYVYIGAGVSSITAANIVDSRNDSSVCGWVVGLIDQIDITDLYNQFTAQFNNWFRDIQDDIDSNTKTMLVAALPKSVTGTLLVSEWYALADGYSQSLSITGMTETKSVIVTPNSESLSDYNLAGIKAATQGTNTITFTADALPTTDISVDVLYMGQ